MNYERKRKNKKIVMIAIMVLIVVSIGLFMANQFLTGNSVLEFLLNR